jgi:plastocyanin domain-containing protein
MKNLMMLCLAIGMVLVIKAEAKKESAKEAQVIELTVTPNGFEPKSIDVDQSKPVTLKVTRTTDSTCARDIQIPIKKVKKDLPLNQAVTIELGKLKKGDVPFGCGMNMMESGKLIVK